MKVLICAIMCTQVTESRMPNSYWKGCRYVDCLVRSVGQQSACAVRTFIFKCEENANVRHLNFDVTTRLEKDP